MISLQFEYTVYRYYIRYHYTCIKYENLDNTKPVKKENKILLY